MSLHSLNVHPPLSYSMCRMAIGERPDAEGWKDSQARTAYPSLLQTRHMTLTHLFTPLGLSDFLCKNDALGVL